MCSYNTINDNQQYELSWQLSRKHKSSVKVHTAENHYDNFNSGMSNTDRKANLET